MSDQNKTEESGTPVRIYPGKDRLAQINRIQAFEQLTKGDRPTKANIIIELMDYGLTAYENKMKEYVPA